ncbi:hypothetical protein SODG_002958 [Sodalis praecaptivus]
MARDRAIPLPRHLLLHRHHDVFLPQTRQRFGILLPGRGVGYRVRIFILFVRQKFRLDVFRQRQSFNADRAGIAASQIDLPRV